MLTSTLQNETLKSLSLMPVEDVFTITGRGTVVTGRIERGVVRTGDVVDIVGLRKKLHQQLLLVSKCSVRS